MKDFVQQYLGKMRDVDWSIKIYLDDYGMYYAVCTFGAETFRTEKLSSVTLTKDTACNLLAQKFAKLEEVGV